MMQLMETMKNLAAMAGYIITLTTLFGLVCKPIRESILNKFTQTSQIKEILEALQDLNDQVKSLNEELNKQVKELRSSIIEIEAQQQDDIEATKCSLRNTITHLYYKYTRIGEIPALERENVSMLCKAYFALGGNSYVQSCYEEIMDLPTC